MCLRDDARHVGAVFLSRLCPPVFKGVGHRNEVVVACAELGVEAHNVTKSVGHKHVKPKSAIGKHVADRACMQGVCRSFVFKKVGKRSLLKVNVVGCYHPFLVQHQWHTLIVEANEGYGEQRTGGITALGKSAAANQTHHVALVKELGYLGVGVGIDEVGGPREVFVLQVHRRKAQFYAVRVHLGHVGSADNLATRARCYHRTDFVEVPSGVEIEGYAQPIVPQRGVETQVKLVFLLVSKVGVSQFVYF